MVAESALVYGGAQKNLGPSGVVLAFVRKDLYPKQKKLPTKLWSFKDQAEAKSMLNTPPTFGVYVLLEVFRWLDAKGGLAAVTRGLAIEYAARGIRVNAVAPGIIRTPMHAADALAALAKLHPMGRLGEVDDVVAAILYLEQAPFVTGEILNVDGGQHAGRW